MAKQRILYVSPEITPYVTSSDNAKLGNKLPTAMNGKKYEVRTFMPNYGSINERRNQLHEVIRLSGINICIDDTDHPLIIKVASMQPSRIQVYFIDNDDYFQKLDSDEDVIGSNREDNDERTIFFSRCTVDTARKLCWEPDILQASGWISALVPMYIKHMFRSEESFVNTKVIYSVLDEAPVAPMDQRLIEKLVEDGLGDDVTGEFAGQEVNVNLLHRMAIANSDAVIFNTAEVDPDLEEYAKSKGIPVLILNPAEENFDQYHEFYQSLLSSEKA